jgi:hypothetical protein
MAEHWTDVGRRGGHLPPRRSHERLGGFGSERRLLGGWMLTGANSAMKVPSSSFPGATFCRAPLGNARVDECIALGSSRFDEPVEIG